MLCLQKIYTINHGYSKYFGYLGEDVKKVVAFVTERRFGTY